jgi:hypothetical protein
MDPLLFVLLWIAVLGAWSFLHWWDRRKRLRIG